MVESQGTSPIPGPGLGASEGTAPVGQATANLGATTPGGGEPGAAATPNKYEGKTQSDLIEMHRQLEKRLTDQGKENTDLRTFVQRIGAFFEVDPQTNEIKFNDEMIKRYGEVKGLWKPEQPQGQQPPYGQPPTEHDPLEGFDETDRQRIQFLIDKSNQGIRDEYNQRLEALERNVRSGQAQGWLEKLHAKYPDFGEWQPKMLEHMKTLNIDEKNITTMEQLESIYRGTKANNDGYVDAKEHAAHVSDLRKAMQAFNPGLNNRPIIDPEKATPEELVGLTGNQGQKEESTEALFGKSFLKEG